VLNVKPRLDDKILTAWNGLMLKATLLLIAPLTNLLLNKAIKNANFLANETITDSNEIMRNYKITKLPFMASSMIMRLLFQHLSNCIRLLLMKSGCIKQKLNDYAITHFMIQNQGCFI
jgi:hypothetical protein